MFVRVSSCPVVCWQRCNAGCTLQTLQPGHWSPWASLQNAKLRSSLHHLQQGSSEGHVEQDLGQGWSMCHSCARATEDAWCGLKQKLEGMKPLSPLSARTQTGRPHVPCVLPSQVTFQDIPVHCLRSALPHLQTVNANGVPILCGFSEMIQAMRMSLA